MSLHGDNLHPLEDPRSIDAGWFDSKRERYSNAQGNNEALRGFVHEELSALQAFYDYNASAEDSAYMITRPISTSPVQTLRGNPDETVALITLWHILVEALLQWPLSRLSDLLALFSAIGRLPRTIQIHNGQATDAQTGTQPLTWDWFPYLSLVWGYALREPGEIVLQAHSGGTPALSQSEYIRRKDIEAQLLAGGMLPLDHRTVQYVTKTLEQEPDSAIPANDAAACDQNRLEFQVPAVASLMTHCGARLFDCVVGKDRDLQRWIRWEERLGAIAADDEFDGPTRSAAGVASAEMQAIRAQA